MVCADFGWLYSLSFLSLGITLVVVGIAYALGQMLSNPQFNVWAKTEIYQVFISAFIVLLIIFISDSFCHFQYSSVAGLVDGHAVYTNPEISDDDNVINASGKYLANIANFAKTEMRAGRTLYGVMEVASRYTRIPCMPAITGCTMGTNGYTLRPYSGLSGWMQALNFSMYTDTASYLTALAQMCLLAFINGKGFMIYLPFAIIIRSLPMMRQFGGGLLAICLSLFLIFPGLLVVESLFWNPYDMLEEGQFDSLSGIADSIDKSFYEAGVDPASAVLEAVAIGFSNWGPIGAAIAGVSVGVALAVIYIIVGSVDLWNGASVVDSVRLVMSAAPIAFLSTTFLFAFNMIAVGAAAREIGRLLGQEVDLSRLMQVV